ncbi:hypothetical protein T439DRAFT_330159 [Meredithblackwellia eburnea MCA 4105]
MSFGQPNPASSGTGTGTGTGTGRGTMSTSLSHQRSLVFARGRVGSFGSPTSLAGESSDEEEGGSRRTAGLSPAPRRVAVRRNLNGDFGSPAAAAGGGEGEGVPGSRRERTVTLVRDLVVDC